MYYFIYRITNLKTNNFFIGKIVSYSKKFKLTHSSNKFLIPDIKHFGREFFKKEIIKEFDNEAELNMEYNKIVNADFKNRNDTYNYKSQICENGKKNIGRGRRTKEIEKLKQIYPDFNYPMFRLAKTNYKIINYCKHGDLIINMQTFNKIYGDNNKYYCEKCFKENMNDLFFTEDEIINNLLKLKNILTTARTHSERYLKKTYPTVYKSILDWTKQYENIEFNERLVLSKKLLKNKPTCVCCENPVLFGDNTVYAKYCRKHANHHHTSKKQKDLYEYIKSFYNNKIEENYKIKNGELDIYMPDLNLAIEFNGLYWHSDYYKEKKYHYNKWKICKDNDIKLITIWEDDWDYRCDIIKSFIKNQLGFSENRIYARNCIIKEIIQEQKSIFLNFNHLQSDTKSKINLGLFHNDELVSVMTFGKKRMIMKSKSENDSEYELLRFCNKLNTSVVGGASKLFKYFIQNFKPTCVISYASCDISDGNLYEILNFTNKGHTGVNYYWASEKRYHRSNFMKYKLVKDGADPFKTEYEIMKERGYIKIYGTGNIKYQWQN